MLIFSTFDSQDVKPRKLTLGEALPIAMMDTWNYRRGEKIRLSDHDRLVNLIATKSLSDYDWLEGDGVGDSQGSCGYI